MSICYGWRDLPIDLHTKMHRLLLYLVYFPHTSDPTSSTSLTQSSPSSHVALLVGTSSLVAFLLTGMTTLFLFAHAPTYLLAWANVLGVLAGVLSCTQYIPQIYTTYNLQRMLSLSVLTLLIQVPGGFLFAFSLYLRVGAEGWSAWLVYCVTATCQACLLAMAIVFHLRDKHEDTHPTTEPSETEPLLQAQDEDAQTISQRAG